ncbi:hypothetical protein Pyn_29753 [Prunus yedoensis var. nudiflora]|uniref:Uncharacterized protein n=1 Tax=Prunus yedoensis var. nudiflora TaxID=2094558 RepID=A0A314YJT5_PRUYE|nr:hypothetical protein Pyn_29753 [Prunus yedoensis var. nudiflora]
MNNSNNPQQPNEAVPVHEQPGMSPFSMATVENVQARARRRWRQPRATSTFFDYTSGRYSWLLPGWVVEERRMPSSRLYRYYYDPSGRLYNTKYEVVHVWAQNGIILIED